MKRPSRYHLILVFVSAFAILCKGEPKMPTTSDRSREMATAPSEGTNDVVLAIPFSLQTDESNAALLGRQCPVIWFASESKTYSEASRDRDIIFAAVVAKALGVSYSEEQFRNAFKKTGRKAAGDYDSLFPEMIEKSKGARVRDIYLLSFWCTASRNWVYLVPLFKSSDSDKQAAARKFVSFPLVHAEEVAGTYDPEVASRCHKLGIRSLGDRLNNFDLAEKFAAEVMEAQKMFLSKFMTSNQVAMVTQPLLTRKKR